MDEIKNVHGKLETHVLRVILLMASEMRSTGNSAHTSLQQKGGLNNTKYKLHTCKRA